MRMAAVPQAPALAQDDDPLQSPSTNSAVDQGMHPLQSWIFCTSVYWPLALDTYPRNAVGLEVDWEEGLDKFEVISNAADAASKEKTAEELELQLESLLEEGSGHPAALLVWKFFIQAIDKHLAEGADLRRLLQLLGGFLSGNISRLFQDAAAYCGCAMLEHWAVHQQPPSQADAAAISEFLDTMVALVKGLGSVGLHLLKERKECSEPSFHPGCRAAALAYSSYTAAKCMQHCTAFTSEHRYDMLLSTVAAAFGLAPLFGAPSEELLSPWQLLAVPLLLSVFNLPTIVLNSVASMSDAPSDTDITGQLENLARCDLMRGYIEMMAELTGPLKVAVLDPERENAALQEETILELLRVSASSILLLVHFRLQEDRFLDCGGVPALVNYLSTYAELQPSLPWEHPAHDVAQKAIQSLLDWQRQHGGADRVLLECGAAATLVAVVGSAPSIMEAARHFQGGGQTDAATPSQASQPQPSFPAMAAGAGQQTQPAQQPRQEFGRYRFAAINTALQLLEALASSSLAFRGALVEADCAGQLIIRMTRLQEGMPLGAVEWQSLPPAVERIVREWTDVAMVVLCRLIARVPSKDAGPKGENKAIKLVDVVLGRLKELVTSADLVGLLKWRVQPARVSETAQRGGTALLPPYALEQSVLALAHPMVAEVPGYCKGLESDEEFMAFVEETLVDGSLATLNNDELQRRWFVLHILKDIVEHCGPASIATRLLRVGAPTGKSIIGAALLGFAQTYPRCIAPEAALAGHMQHLLDKEPSSITVEEYIRKVTSEFENSVGLVHAAMELLEALLKQNAPELQMEAARIKAYMESLNLKQVAATRGPPCTDGRIKEAGQMARACIKRVDKLAGLGQRMTQLEQQAALEAAEAAAATLLAEEEAAQQASAGRVAKRQRQKAAKQKQQATAAAEQEQQEREREEREQREGEERERKSQEKAQRAAEAAAAALQAEQEAAQQRAAAKAAKRQRKKAAKQAQQQAAGASAASTADAAAPSIVTLQPRGSTAIANSTPAAVSLLPDTPFLLQLASQQGPAAAAPKIAGLPGPGGSEQQILNQQGKQQKAGKAVAGLQGPCTTQGVIPAEVATPEQTEAWGVGAHVEDDQMADSEFQALLSILIPGAVEPSRAPSPPPPTWPPAGSLDSNNSTSMQQQGSTPAPGLASVLHCALSRQQLQDPVVAADGWTYEREVIAAWLAAGETRSPVTRQPLSSIALRPNYALRQLLDR